MSASTNNPDNRGMLDARLSSLQFLRELASEGSRGKISSAIVEWEAREGYSKPDFWKPRVPILYHVQNYNGNSTKAGEDD